MRHVVHAGNGGDHIRKPARNERVPGVRVCVCGAESRNLHREGALRLLDGAAELEVARLNPRNFESFIAQPVGKRLDFWFSRTETLKELSALQPLMIIRRCGILLLGEQLLERSRMPQRKANLHLKLRVEIEVAGDGRGLRRCWMIAGQLHPIVAIAEAEK